MIFQYDFRLPLHVILLLLSVPHIHPQDLIRRLFVCISACPTNYASDLGKILKSVFFTIQTKEEESQMSRKRRTRRTGPSGEVIPVLQGLKLHNW